MQHLRLTTPGQPAQYPIFIGSGLLAELPTLVGVQHYSKILVVSDTNVGKLWLETLTKALLVPHETLVLPAGEQAKNIHSVEKIWAKLHAMHCDRKSLIIALGGGVLGDMTGFAAATYMRGIDCIQVPTTVVSQVDSSVGGKNAFDFDGVKNLIGTFCQPKAVVVDTNTLRTLPRREFISGFAEIIKHGFILDAAYLQLVTSKKPADFSAAELETIIAGSCRIKAAVVEGDETESGHRKILNFGHTIGHAIETLSLDTATPLLHGEAISIGMVVETELSKRHGNLSAVEAALLNSHLQAAGLPVVVQKNFATDAIIRALLSDKKNTHGVVNFVMLEHFGQAVHDQVVAKEAIADAIEHSRRKPA